MGDCRKGRRPSFSSAARPDEANALYEKFVQAAGDMGVKVETGRFQAHMVVDIENDGPVTMLVDSKRGF
jgi:D-tyrosyl-tRNA(Tyr) deacylase